MGVFFVKKKSGQLRLICDTRISNCDFVDAPSTKLPSPAAFASIESSCKRPLHIASGDLDVAFYHMRLPEGMEEHFSLPAIDSSFLTGLGIDGLPAGPGVGLLPCVCVLPMGFTWALHLCQESLQHALRATGFSLSDQVLDGTPGVTLRTASDVGTAAYVDIFSRSGRTPT